MSPAFMDFSKMEIRLMKKYGILSVIILSVCFANPAHGLDLAPARSEPDSCGAPGRNLVLCLKMKQLRSQVSLFDAQRDLMQMNPPYLERIASDMSQVVSSILVSGSADPHLEQLTHVRKAAQDAAELAQAGDLDVLKRTNEIRASCLACHSNHAPTSGHEWDKISKLGWDYILVKCNSTGRNPYGCKSVHAIASNVAFLEASDQAGLINLEAVGAAAGEVIRIVQDLRDKRSSEVSLEVLVRLERQAVRVKQLALESGRDLSLAIRELAATAHAAVTPCLGPGPGAWDDSSRALGQGIPSLPERFIEAR